MTTSVIGLVLVLVCLIISVIFALIGTPRYTDPVWWVLLGILLALIFAVKVPGA